jgi:hypothetical protein
MAAPGTQIIAFTLRMLLLPVVRFCLRRAVKFQEFSSIAREIFIEAARRELLAKDASASTSRLSVVTGLTRREVDRLVKSAPAAAEEQNLIIKVLGQWNGDRGFLDAHGNPKTLTFEGLESQFAKLVGLVSKDLNHHTVLFEMERLGFVVRQEDKVKLVIPAYITRENAKEGAQMLGSDVEDLVRAVETNVLESVKLPHLHARTEYDNIAPEKLPEIQRWLLEFGKKVHTEARKFLSRFDMDINPAVRSTKPGARVKVGTFSFAVERGERGRR